MNSTQLITGSLQVRLSFTDGNGTLQDVALQQLDPTLFNVLPAGLQQAKGSPLLKGNLVGPFDQLWQQTDAALCGEISSEIRSQTDSSQNGAYNVTCTPNPKGALNVTLLSEWQDPYGFTVTGRRLMFDYLIPFNDAVFSVTSPCTCRQSNLVCAADPQVTTVFQTSLEATFDSADKASFSLPVTDAHAGGVAIQYSFNGDYGNAVHNAMNQWIAGIGISAAAGAATGPAGPYITTAGLLATTGKLLAQLGGIAVGAACNMHLADTIGMKLELSSGEAGNDAITMAQMLDALFNDLADMYLAGFTQFDAVAGDDGSLIFRLTAPLAAKPTLVNLTAEANGHPSLFQPTLAVSQNEAPAGSKLPVRVSFFKGGYSTSLRIGWNNTLSVLKTTAVDWQQSGGPLQHATVAQPAFTTAQPAFEADNLRPATNYQFRVHECGPIACAPESDWFTFTTQAQGSDKVSFALDDPSHPFGGTTLGADGGFATDVTIPPGTAPGQHKLIASVGGQQASVMLTICGASGCNPAIALFDASTNTAHPPGWRTQVRTNFSLQGIAFVPGNTVNVYIDRANGQLIGAATVGSGGAFEATFTMPTPQNGYGNHMLVAVESAGGRTLQASVAIWVDGPVQ